MDVLFTETVRTVQEQKVEQARLALEKENREAQEKRNRDNTRKAEIARLVKNAQVNIDFMTRKQKGNMKFPCYLTTLFEKRATIRSWLDYQEASGKPEVGDEITADIDSTGVKIKSQRIQWVQKEEFVLSLAEISQEEDTESPREKTTHVVLLAGKVSGLVNKIDPEQKITAAVFNCSIQSVPTFEVDWIKCDLYEDTALDKALKDLAALETTIQRLVEKFGLPQEWRDEY